MYLLSSVILQGRKLCVCQFAVPTNNRLCKRGRFSGVSANCLPSTDITLKIERKKDRTGRHFQSLIQILIIRSMVAMPAAHNHILGGDSQERDAPHASQKLACLFGRFLGFCTFFFSIFFTLWTNNGCDFRRVLSLKLLLSLLSALS